MKSDLVKKAVEILSDSGYLVLDCSGLRSCFDLVARKDQVLIIKILANIDGLTRKNCSELQDVASMTSTVPLVLGDHMKSAKLSEGVIYARYGIHALNLKTLEGVVNENLPSPSIYSVRGNYCIGIDSKLLVKLRKELNLTQQKLAYELNVSKQTIHRYELSGRMCLNIAERLMDLLGKDITLPQKVFSFEEITYSENSTAHITSLKKMVLEKFQNLGFSTALTNAPFDIVAIELNNERVITTVSDDSRRLRLKVEIMNDVSEILGIYGVCISNRNEDSDVVILKPGELNEINDSDELISILSGS